MRAWHFVDDKLRDGSPVPPDGEWLEHDGPVTMCESGLHFSLDPFDALKYAPGSTLCRVEVEGVVATEDDKGVCRQRRILERHDVTDTLRLFARQCALDVIHLWDAPEIVRRYLETGDESIRDAARAAARDAAWDSAWAAARDAAWAAAWDVARDAAWAAARDAARAAARDSAWAAARYSSAWAVARDSAWAAAWDARDAAWAAAWDARDAAWAAQRKRFSDLILPLFEVEQ